MIHRDAGSLLCFPFPIEKTDIPSSERDQAILLALSQQLLYIVGKDGIFSGERGNLFFNLWSKQANSMTLVEIFKPATCLKSASQPYITLFNSAVTVVVRCVWRSSSFLVKKVYIFVLFPLFCEFTVVVSRDFLKL